MQNSITLKMNRNSLVNTGLITAIGEFNPAALLTYRL